MSDFINEEHENITGIEKQAPDRITDKERNRYRDLDNVIKEYIKKPGHLIGILHKAQEIFGYLPEEVQTYIASKTGIPVSEVNGVVTFYSLFSTEPKGKYEIKVCLGTACYVKGAQEIMDTLKENLKIDEEETTQDKLFTLKSTRCIGSCGLAPVLLANEDVYGEIAAKDVMKIVREYQKGEKIEN
ncbi:NAD(P)H-dependent oxidoreductase subunit E [Pelotomaculum terephthalicicum JT]|uniref:NADH-quinone oxidoreductase subunit NuoE family protein n=1 Tax=Pelotomaculum terephthalicicum TaxID=206393 RepID=UPI0009CF52C2|nr:NAD(P)H-dependent oxidoreductase subunit E [Pelotomaculum terephthalicicum]MCG9967831.1 NAD(P)H-dependent oxidoreductase subunit E [Pelotomaculum terephthalicicum JT]OPY62366.1 MAG: NADP-reducing hydrogenase subunit HndA [Pelotomaculum sp. PtaU1.Bin065]